MKKLMLAALVGLMVIATAGVAAAEITVGGSMEMRYDLWNNLDLNRNLNQNTTTTQTQNFFADRILLNVDAKITEGLEAFVEMDTTTNGKVDERLAGAQSTDLTAKDSALNYQGERLAVRQAWINFMIPGLPVGLKVGHQPLALGHGITLDSHRYGQDAILLYSKPIDQLLLAGVYVKALENSSGAPAVLNGNEHKDVDVWAALANYTWAPNNTAGLFYLYAHDGTNVPGVADNTGATMAVARLHWVGLSADGALGPVTYKAEVDYQDVNGQRHTDTENGEQGVNNAWAGLLGVGAKVAIVNVGAEAAYGTGTTGNARFGSQIGSSTATGARTFATPYGATSYNYAFLYNDKIGQGTAGVGSFNQGGGGGLGLGDGTGGFGLANTGYVKVTAAVNPMDKLGIDLAALYLRASAPSFPSQSRDLGWEVDAHAGYKIYDNLNLDVTGGVFIPGAWYAYAGRPAGSITVANKTQLTDGNDPNSPLKRNLAYGLETKLTVKF